MIIWYKMSLNNHILTHVVFDLFFKCKRKCGSEDWVERKGKGSEEEELENTLLKQKDINAAVNRQQTWTMD